MLTCGWCGTHYGSFVPNCKNCGGPLPPPPGMALGPEPPPAPRALPGNFERRVLWTHNVFALVGGIFLLVATPLVIGLLFVNPLFSLFPMIHFTIGYLLLRHGRGKGLATIHAFRDGRAARGEISETQMDTTTKINGRHPWIIRYKFPVAGTMHEGHLRAWEADARGRERGQPLWVLYLDEDPEKNTIYPPLK